MTRSEWLLVALVAGALGVGAGVGADRLLTAGEAKQVKLIEPAKATEETSEVFRFQLAKAGETKTLTVRQLTIPGRRRRTVSGSASAEALGEITAPHLPAASVASVTRCSNSGVIPAHVGVGAGRSGGASEGVVGSGSLAKAAQRTGRARSAAAGTGGGWPRLARRWCP